MRRNKKLLLINFLMLFGISLFAQEIIEINTESLKVNHEGFPLSNADGWVYKQGNNDQWAEVNLNTEDWINLKPTELSVEYAEKNGRHEGWFRVKIRIDSSLSNTSLYINKRSRDAADVYLNGVLFKSFGKIDDSKNSYEAYIDNTLFPIPISLKPDSVYTIAIHTLDYTEMYPRRLRGQMSGPHAFFDLATDDFFQERKSYWKYDSIFKSLWLTTGFLLSFLFWFLVFLNPKEKDIKVIAICSTLSTMGSLGMTFLDLGNLNFNQWKFSAGFMYAFIFAYLSYIPRAISQIFLGSISKTIKYITALFMLIGLINVISIWQILPMILVAIGSFSFILYISIRYWRKVKGAQWALVIGIISTVVFVALLVSLVFLMQHKKMIGISVQALNVVTTFVFLSLPVSMLIYVAIRFKEIIQEVRKNANEIVKIAEEKKELLATQNIVLESLVSERTSELSKSLEDLKSTQAQLIQSEKMASLGELTAGIAHEIQNPLNFVNNFSEVSNELIDEMKEELEKGDKEEALAIADDIKGNLEKINHHGKRADAIVKGMLQHSRISTGQKEPTDLNALADEYLRLAYHACLPARQGLRAKDNAFNADFKTNLDPNLPKVNIIPQDIGRVLLNLINNAFYAVNDKSQKTSEEYEPTVSVSTKYLNDTIEISVKDNGSGIPDSIKDKIFQPFFTTKPTGQGTGLGLSLAYDIVKAYGGEIHLTSGIDLGSEFSIILPNLSSHA